jgi:negative regulator of genetic competence, sporulation and motility
MNLEDIEMEGIDIPDVWFDDGRIEEYLCHLCLKQYNREAHFLSH